MAVQVCSGALLMCTFGVAPAEFTASSVGRFRDDSGRCDH
jgi:hypothetical protein